MNSQIVVKTNLFGHYSIAYDCPLCHTALRSKLSEAGQKDICPECQKSFTVPSPRDKDTADVKAKEIEPRVTLETEEERWRKEQMWYLHRASENRKLEEETRLESGGETTRAMGGTSKSVPFVAKEKAGGRSSIKVEERKT